MEIQTINPSTEENLTRYSLLKMTEVSKLIDAAHLSYQAWRQTDFCERRQLMLAVAALLRRKQDEYAVLMASEMGKPVTAGKAEIEKCALVCEHYAENAKSYLESKIINTENKKNIICYRPLGVVFAIMPWNFPFWQVFRFAAPTIMAGNTAILKHAPISSGTGKAIAELFLEAGFPKYVFQHFLLNNEMAASVIAHEKIVAVTLTGSELAGSIVAAEAARHLKKSVLELGGNDPYIILSDADLSHAANCIVTSRLNNNGQVCIAAKRIIAVKDVGDDLIDKIVELVNHYHMGDPLDPATTLGPMAREDLRSTLHKQVLASKAKGATILMGGKIPQCRGYYYPPTILTNVHPGMPAFDDELFGPVFSIIIADNEAHAINLANQSRYGLGAAVFTRDLARGEQIATEEIETGSCFVNAVVASDPRIPFGGIKRSGFGRELSQEGILAFMNIKTVSLPIDNEEIKKKFIIISATDQLMHCYENNEIHKTYSISTGKNGLGEQMGSECTPRGWHCIHSILGLDNVVNSVFVGRRWTGEIYSSELALKCPERDWILTRILQLDGLEPGRNKGGQVDSLERFIYIHGTPDTTPLGAPGSHGCVRMRNADIMALAEWVTVGCRVCIE